MKRQTKKAGRAITALGFAGAALWAVMTGPQTAAGAQTNKPAVVSPRVTARTDGVRLVPPGGAIKTIHTGAVSRDGRLFVTSGTDNTALVWETATGRLVRRFPAKDVVKSALMLPSSRVLVTDRKANIAVWDISTGTLVRTFSARPAGYVGYCSIEETAVQADGARVAVSIEGITSGGRGRLLRVFDIATGQPVVHETRFAGTAGRMRFAANNTLFIQDDPGYTPPGRQPSRPHALVALDPGNGKTLFRIPDADIPLAFSPDGKRILASEIQALPDNKEKRGVCWYDAVTGVKLKQVGALFARDGIALSPDGTRIANWTYPDKMSVVSAETGETIREMVVGEDTPGMTFLPGGDLLMTVRGTGKITRLAPDGKTVATIGGVTGLTTATALSRDGKTALIITKSGTGSRLLRWDLLRNAPAGPPIFTDTPLWPEAKGSTNGFVAARSPETNARVWNARTGALVADLGVNGNRQPVFSADEKFCALPDLGVVREFSTETDALIRTYTVPESGERKSGIHTAVLYTADGERLIAGDTEGNIFVFRRSTGALIGEGVIHEPAAQNGDAQNRSQGTVYDLALVPGAPDRAVFRGMLGYTGEYDLGTGRVVQTFTRYQEFNATAVGVYPDSKTVAVGSADGGIHLFNRATGAADGVLAGHSGDVDDLVFSSDGRRLTSQGKDGTIRFFDLARRKELLTTLVFVPTGETGEATGAPEWIAYNQTGFFDGSPGATRRVHFADGAQTFGADQFFERYFRSGLLAQTLGAGSAASTAAAEGPTASEAVRTGTPPLVKIVSPTEGQVAKAGTVEIIVEATEQAQGGVKAIRLYHNGRLVGGPSALRGIAIEAVAGATTTKKFTVALASGVNELKAVAYSKTDLESAPATVAVAFKPAEVEKPTLHVLSVGINTYKDATMNLAYARPDAESLADLYDGAKGGKARSGLFSRVSVSRLLDADATGAAILSGLASLAAATNPEDVVLIYLAGHGETAENTWYFLPSEMRQMVLPERVKEFGIPWGKIEAAVGRIPARKIVLVVDACKSGAIVNGVRGGVGEQQALAIMARAQGIHILTASTGQQYAGEVKALGHGILTYALLEGLSGKAGPSIDTAVMVRDVLSYVEIRVPELSLKYRGEAQYPVPFDRGQNFPITLKQ